MFLLVLFNLRRIDDLVTIQIGSERKKILCRDDVGCTLFRDSNKVANAVKTSCTCQKSGISITLLSGGFLISRVDKSTLANYENRFHSNKITTNTIGEMIQAKINHQRLQDLCPLLHPALGLSLSKTSSSRSNLHLLHRRN